MIIKRKLEKATKTYIKTKMKKEMSKLIFEQCYMFL